MQGTKTAGNRLWGLEGNLFIVIDHSCCTQSEHADLARSICCIAYFGISQLVVLLVVAARFSC